MESFFRSSESFLGVEGPWAWGVAIALAVVATLVIIFVLTAVLARLKRLTDRTASEWDDLIIDTLSATKAWVVFVWAFVSMLPALNVHASVIKAGRTAVVIATAIQIMLWGFRAIHHWRKTFLMKRIESDASSVAAIGLLVTAAQFILVVTIVMLGLSNLGIDVGALVAGLGVGGIAVALAAQNVLGDLLASLSIVLDKPFVVGDFIAVGSDQGTVQNIGIKTTRLRSLSGEELVFSNKDLLESRVQNFKRMTQRRVRHMIGVTYSTPLKKLEKIPEWISNIIVSEEKLQLDRCHLVAYGASSLDFELVYFVNDAQFNVHADIQQRVLLKVFRKFAEEKVEFAYPSQSLYVEKLPKLAMESETNTEKVRDSSL